jgi:hypothetical protein
MRKKTLIILQLFFLFFATSVVLGCGTTGFASSKEGKSPMLKPESASPPAASGKGVSMRVLWTVSRYVITPDAQWQKEDADKLLFKPLDITATSITFNGKTCRDVIFKKEKTNTKEYLENILHATPQALGIEEEIIEVIKTNCALPGFDRYMRLKYGRLAICINGVFFFFEPAMNY